MTGSFEDAVTAILQGWRGMWARFPIWNKEMLWHWFSNTPTKDFMWNTDSRICMRCYSRMPMVSKTLFLHKNAIFWRQMGIWRCHWVIGTSSGEPIIVVALNMDYQKNIVNGDELSVVSFFHYLGNQNWVREKWNAHDLGSLGQNKLCNLLIEGSQSTHSLPENFYLKERFPLKVMKQNTECIWLLGRWQASSFFKTIPGLLRRILQKSRISWIVRDSNLGHHFNEYNSESGYKTGSSLEHLEEYAALGPFWELQQMAARGCQGFWVYQ